MLRLENSLVYRSTFPKAEVAGTEGSELETPQNT